MLKVGILGGGQLGRMLLQAAANYPVETYVLENDSSAPAAHLCHYFRKGDIRNFNDVYNFGKGLDALTIEIESVNIEALEKLESEGVVIYPKPSALRILKKQDQAKKNITVTAKFLLRHLLLQKILRILKNMFHFYPRYIKLQKVVMMAAAYRL